MEQLILSRLQTDCVIGLRNRSTATLTLNGAFVAIAKGPCYENYIFYDKQRFDHIGGDALHLHSVVQKLIDKDWVWMTQFDIQFIMDASK